MYIKFKNQICTNLFFLRKWVVTCFYTDFLFSLLLLDLLCGQKQVLFSTKIRISFFFASLPLAYRL